jgi:hypothetical protein
VSAAGFFFFASRIRSMRRANVLLDPCLASRRVRSLVSQAFLYSRREASTRIQLGTICFIMINEQKNNGIQNQLCHFKASASSFRPIQDCIPKKRPWTGAMFSIRFCEMLWP